MAPPQDDSGLQALPPFARDATFSDFLALEACLEAYGKKFGFTIRREGEDMVTVMLSLTLFIYWKMPSGSWLPLVNRANFGVFYFPSMQWADLFLANDMLQAAMIEANSSYVLLSGNERLQHPLPVPVTAP